MSREGTGAEPVVFIGGHGRSGSTLLGRMLDTQPEMVFVGETHYLWRTVRWNRDCACGLAIRDCPFWSTVGVRAFGGWDRVDLDEVQRSQGASLRTKGSLGLLRHGAGWRRASAYSRALGAVFDAVREVSGCRVVVDSSKLPQTAYLLRLMPGVDLRVVHLVRSPYGVVFSWQNPKNRSDGKESRGLRVFEPKVVARQWQAFNGLLEILSLAGVDTVRIRYEDLVGQPGAAFDSILAMVGLDPTAAASPVSPDGVRLGVSHVIAGNPDRFASGLIPLRLDDRWTRELDDGVRREVSRLTLPLRWRYGYRPAG